MGLLRDALGRLLFDKELLALHRYQQASSLVWRWNGEMPQSAHTAQWIAEVGEGKRGLDIQEFRECLRKGETPHWMDKDAVPES
jgi:hypothetical protein